MLLRNADSYFASLLGLGWNCQTPGIVCYDAETVSETDTADFRIGSHNLAELMGTLAPTEQAGFVSRRSSCPDTVGVVFGTGRTRPTIYNCCLSGEFVTGITVENTLISVTGTPTSKYAQLECTYTITNNTSSPIQIGEIGLVNTCSSIDPETQAPVYWTVLVERTLLGETLNIPAGGVGRIVYTTVMNHPVTASASSTAS